MSTRSTPYIVPSPVALLVLSSFIYLLNVVRASFHWLIYAGSVGEILMGMVYGAPLGQILEPSWQETTRDLGYVGLILIVFEGGLHTQLGSLQDNLWLSTVVAITGVTFPIVFSFLLLTVGFGYTWETSFACGAALSITSLGTTFSILSSNAVADNDKKTGKDIRHTRIGSILLAAALLDDISGLVMASILPTIASIATTKLNTGSLVVNIIRPCLVSTVIFCLVVVNPVRKRLVWALQRVRDILVRLPLANRKGKEGPVILFLLVALASGATVGTTYAGASGLTGAWVAGCLMGCVDEKDIDDKKASDQRRDEEAADLCLSPIQTRPSFPTQPQGPLDGQNSSRRPTKSTTSSSGTHSLTPLYTSLQQPHTLTPIPETPASPEADDSKSFRRAYDFYITPVQAPIFEPFFFASIGYAIPFLDLWKGRVLWRGLLYSLLMLIGKAAACIPILFWPVPKPKPTQPTTSEKDAVAVFTSETGKDKNKFYPSLFLGLAMVARGEIGLIVAQIGNLPAEAYLVVMWSILLCTVLSAACVGGLLRYRRAQCTAGIWG